MEELFNRFSVLSSHVRSLGLLVQNDIDFKTLTKDERAALSEDLSEFHSHADQRIEELKQLKYDVGVFFKKNLS